MTPVLVFATISVVNNETPGASTFRTTSAAYHAFMGRYSEPLAVRFADWIGITAGQSAVDVGCGPGAMTAVLCDRLGEAGVSACDPSPPFVEECSAAFPGADVRPGRAEAIPFDDISFDVAVSQLVLHFVSDPDAAAREMRRVVKPGGTVAACIWTSPYGMAMFSGFWHAVASAGLEAPPDADVVRMGGSGEIVELFTGAGLVDAVETVIEVTSPYSGFDELWSGLAAGIGPAGAFCKGLDDDDRAAVRRAMFDILGAPEGGFELAGTARCARGRVPG